MGGTKSKIAFEICAVTSDYKVGASDLTVSVVLFDENGKRSPVFTLDNLFSSEEDGSIKDKFTIPTNKWCKTFGQNITCLEFGRTSGGQEHEWFCEKIIVRDRRKGLGGNWVHYFFPVHRWVLPDKVYIIYNMETFLPNLDPQPENRREELAKCQQKYQYSQRAAGMPLELKFIPEDEMFSHDVRWDIEQIKEDIIYQKGMESDYRSVDHWDSFDLMNSIYGTRGITEPASLNQSIMNDVCFGAQRVKGCNPFVITLCKEIPENFGVAVEWLKPYLEGWTLKHIIDAKRLFLVDYKIMEGVECKPGRQLCAPLALFFCTESRQLKPLAIQLNQEIEEGNPVFISTDSAQVWLLAKLWFNMVDACYSLVVNRLLTHLILEGIYAAMRRNMSPAHPIFKLMAPHFRHILAVNRKLKDWVFNEDGWIAQNIQLSRKGVRQLLRKAFKQWRFDRHAYIYREFESRGVYDPKALPQYPYRDDALPVYKVLDAYVTKVVRYYYANPLTHTRQKLLADHELQGWRKECSAPVDEGGLGIQGIPGKDGVLNTSEDTAKFLSSLLYLIVIQSHAARAPQFDESGYPANYPLCLHGRLPVDPMEEDSTIHDVLNAVPNKRESIDTLLSFRLCHKESQGTVTKGVNQLANYEVEYSYDPQVLQFSAELKQQLSQISDQVAQKNKQRDINYKYNYFDPANIPNYMGI